MELIPAIDILDGRVVQLTRDDYDTPKVFRYTPIEAAQHWVEAGATRLHIVDLGAARTGIRSGDDVLAEMIHTIDVPVQASGGIRDVRTVETLIGVGVSRVIFGPVAIQNPQVVREAIQNVGAEHVIIGIAARSGVVATDGWTTTSQRRAVDVITEWVDQGVTQFMYRDVDQDGTLRGPNISSLGELQNAVKGNLTVAGGIGDVQHLRNLSEIGIESVVLGTSIYTGSIDFKSAVEEFHT
ncbi:MAG: 1-(5-phosphoribosyl)-5-[(5-phosphoribosylamino)methylideneamino] imidazole-4-carboxamide isomerase [Chloroflexi bacterium]|nr:1-(5-phosphoribosyl)-5-[(5-phosphoribosylamino)methylideneamino] imidazole-4-carboxamide isomerase [Chloroflexota bacterium]